MESVMVCDVGLVKNLGTVCGSQLVTRKTNPPHFLD